MEIQRSKRIVLSIILSFFMIFSTTVVPITSVQAETMVLVTRTGSKYHTHKCGNGTYYESTLSAALARGLEPCQKCFGSSYSGGGASSGYTPAPISNPTPTPAPAPQPAPKPKKISLSKKSVELVKGDTKKLTVKNASGSIKWRTNNKSVATVSHGIIKAKGAGKTTIKVAANGQTKYCKVKVEAPKISKTNLTLETGERNKLKISGCKHNIKWKSNKKEIASVDRNGQVYAKEPGKTTVIGKVHGKQYKCTVKVTKPKITDIDILNPIDTMQFNSTYTLEVVTDNDDIFDYVDVEATSSDESIISVSDTYDNEIELETNDVAGSATITISVDGVETELDITVLDDSLTGNNDNLDWQIGKKFNSNVINSVYYEINSWILITSALQYMCL